MIETNSTIAVGKEFLHNLQADAARWRFVRDNMIRSHGKVDGSAEVYFCFAASIGYGVSATDAVDRLINRSGS